MRAAAHAQQRRPILYTNPPMPPGKLFNDRRVSHSIWQLQPRYPPDAAGVRHLGLHCGWRFPRGLQSLYFAYGLRAGIRGHRQLGRADCILAIKPCCRISGHALRCAARDDSGRHGRRPHHCRAGTLRPHAAYHSAGVAHYHVFGNVLGRSLLLCQCCPCTRERYDRG